MRRHDVRHDDAYIYGGIGLRGRYGRKRGQRDAVVAIALTTMVGTMIRKRIQDIAVIDANDQRHR